MACPRVSVGLPVYNAEKFLPAALDSLLRQSFTNFEIVVSDNASTDNTEQICRSHAQKDDRIRYYRNSSNLGAAANFNRVVGLARGEFFKWSAHDDVHLPTFIERCVDALDNNADVVLSYTLYSVIDDRGRAVRKGSRPGITGSLEAHKRFYQAMTHQLGAPMIWGLMRTEVLRSTPLIATYYQSDLVLLAEISLHGMFHEIPHELFLHREHVDRSVYTTSPQSYVKWLDSRKRFNSIFPTWRVVWEYQRSVLRGPIGWKDKIRCWIHTLKWMKWNWRKAWSDIADLKSRCWPGGNAESR